MLSALDPGKQGLKLSQFRHGVAPFPRLSALDPGKQGLKLPIIILTALDLDAFSA